MGRANRAGVLLACAGCLALGYFWGSWKAAPLRADQQPAPKAPPPFPTALRLGADLYAQTSAEYRACCLQVYRCAERRLETILATARPQPARPAVVMDLDETVLDNSAFESFLQQNKLDYSDALWEIYERDYPDEVALVPGAREFIESARKKDVTVVYISNRLEKNRASTLKALRRLGLDDGREKLDPDWSRRLFLRQQGTSSDKAARREQVAARYNVLLTFGDSLRDFSEAFAAPKLVARDDKEEYARAIQRRLRQVDDARCHWGVDWFVLPNPVYGEWEKLLGADPKARLRPTKIKVPKGG